MGSSITPPCLIDWHTRARAGISAVIRLSGSLKPAIACGLAILALTAGPAAFGQTTVTWTNAANGNWGLGTNWSTSSIPTSANNVLIDRNGITVTVATNSTGSASNVTVGATTSGSSTTLSVTGTGVFGGDLTLGGVGSGALTLGSATSSLSVSGSIVLAPSASTGNATITLSASSASLTVGGGSGTIFRGSGSGNTSIVVGGTFTGSINAASITVDDLNMAQSGPATYTINAGQTLNSLVNLRLNNASTVANSSAVLNVNGGVLNNGTEIKFLSGTNTTNTGYLNLNSGTLTAVSLKRMNQGTDTALNFNNGTIANYSGSNTTISSASNAWLMPILLSGTGTNVFRADAGRTITVQSTAVLGNKSGENGAFRMQGAGTLILSGSNSYTGGTTLDSGTIQLGAAGALGPSGNITFSGGVLQYTAAGTGTDYSSRIVNSGSAITVDSNSQSITLAALGASNTGGLRKLGSGTVTLSAANGFTGLTQVGAGSLTLGDVNALSTSTLDLATADSGTVAFSVAGTNVYNLGGLQGSRNLANAGNELSIGGNNASTTYSGTLSGGGNLTKVGSGTFTLSAANTFTGTTTVSAGRLAYGVNDALAAGAVTVNGSGAVLDLGSFSDTVGAVTLTDGSIIGSGTLSGSSYSVASGTISAALGGTGGLTKTGAGTVVLSAANSYTGLTTVSGGILRLGTNQSVSRAGNSVTVTSGTFDLNGYTFSGTSTTTQGGISLGGGAAGTRAVIATGTGTLVVTTGSGFPWISYDATNNPLGAEISGKLQIVPAGNFTGFMAGDSTAAADDLTISAVISGSLNNLYSSQAGTIVFSGVNTFASTANQVRAGTWVLATDSLRNANGALGNNLSGIEVGHNATTADATLLLRGNVTTDRAVTIVTNTVSPLTYVRTVGGDATSGTATFSGGMTINANARLTAANGGTVVFSGGLVNGASNFQSAATITKIGLGTVILSGSSSTTLPWAVQAGRLLVNGTNAGSGGTTVDAGALLGGSGRINGLVTVSGTLSPGNSPGILTLSQLALTSTATTLMEINGLTRGSQYDGIDLTTAGGLTYAGALSIAFGLGGAVADNTTFDLFNFTGTPSGDFASVISTGGVYAGTWSQISSGTWSLQSGAQTLTFSTTTGDIIVVPEPGTLAMLAGVGFVAAVALARRRK